MEKSVLGLIFRLINLKKGMTTTDVMDTDETFFVKLCVFNIEKYLFNTQLPLNEDDNNFDEQLNDIHYKRTVRELHSSGWKNIYFDYAVVSMLGYGCGMSQYPRFYDK